MVVAEDVAVMPKKRRELGAASDRSTSPPSSPDALASPPHSSSGYPSPYLSSVSSVSGSFRLFMVVGQAAVSESEPSSVVA